MEQYPSDNFIPQREPNEVTLEYVAEPKPYVAYYVQDCPLPGRKPETAAQEPPAKTCRKGHRGLKIFLICLAAVLVLAGGLYAAWWFGLLPDRFYGDEHGDYYDDPDYYYYYGELDESAEPELPVVSADDGVRLVYADGHGDALTIQEIYRRVNPSTVTVVTELPRGASVGTGVILTEDGYVVTNYHVVQNASNITVTTHTGDEYDATVKGYVDMADLTERNIRQEGNRLTVILPDPRVELTATKVDHKQTRQFVRFLGRNFTDAERSSFERQGRDSIIASLPQSGINENARASAARILVPLLTQMGYKEEDITITFRKEFTGDDLRHMITTITQEKKP